MLPDETRTIAPDDDAGWLVLLVGPSGAGKDTLIDWLARNRTPDVDFEVVRRTVTRPEGCVGEDHNGVEPARFETMDAEGAFAVTWQAHGLSYGLPFEALRRVRSGTIMIGNGSRHALPAIRAAFGRVHVVAIDVAPDELRRRLIARGRETEADIAARLARKPVKLPEGLPVTHVDNSGLVEVAGRTILDLIASLRDGMHQTI